jgi:aromatic ring-cleaving dioxygenase
MQMLFWLTLKYLLTVKKSRTSLKVLHCDNHCALELGIWHSKRRFGVYSNKAATALLVVHREQRYIRNGRTIEGMSPWLKEALQALVILIHPRHREEISIVYSPV